MDAVLSPAESALSSVSDESQGTKDPDYREDQHTQAPSTATNSDEMVHHPSTRSSSKNLSPDSNGPEAFKGHQQPEPPNASARQNKQPVGAPGPPNRQPTNRAEFRAQIANIKVVQVLQLTSELILVWQALRDTAGASQDGALVKAMNQRVQSCLSYLSGPIKAATQPDPRQTPILDPPYTPTNLPAGIPPENAQKLLATFARVRQSFSQAEVFENQMKAQASGQQFPAQSVPSTASPFQSAQAPQVQSSKPQQSAGQKRERDAEPVQAPTPRNAPTPMQQQPEPQEAQESKRRRSSASPGTMHPSPQMVQPTLNPPASHMPFNAGTPAEMGLPTSMPHSQPFAAPMQPNMFQQPQPMQPRPPSVAQHHQMPASMGAYPGMTSQSMPPPGFRPQTPQTSNAMHPPQQQQFVSASMPPPPQAGRPPMRPPSSMGKPPQQGPPGIMGPRPGMMAPPPASMPNSIPPQLMGFVSSLQQLQGQMNHIQSTLAHPSSQTYPPPYRSSLQAQHQQLTMNYNSTMMQFKQAQSALAGQMHGARMQPGQMPPNQMPPGQMPPRPASRAAAATPAPGGVPYRGPTPSAMPQHLQQQSQHHHQRPGSPHMSSAQSPFYPPSVSQTPHGMHMRSGSMNMGTPMMSAASPAQSSGYSGAPFNAPTPTNAPTPGPGYGNVPQQMPNSHHSSPSMAQMQLNQAQQRNSFPQHSMANPAAPMNAPFDQMQTYQRHMQGQQGQPPNLANMTPQQQQAFMQQRSALMFQQAQQQQQLQHQQQQQQQMEAMRRQSQPSHSQPMAMPRSQQMSPPAPHQSPYVQPTPQPPSAPTPSSSQAPPQPLTTNPAQLAAMLQQKQQQEGMQPNSSFSAGAADPLVGFSDTGSDPVAGAFSGASSAPGGFGMDMGAPPGGHSGGSGGNEEEFNWEDFITG